MCERAALTSRPSLDLSPFVTIASAPLEERDTRKVPQFPIFRKKYFQVQIWTGQSY
jgi:hypothetical protein